MMLSVEMDEAVRRFDIVLGLAVWEFPVPRIWGRGDPPMSLGSTAQS
jgi:hypothetical protein